MSFTEELCKVDELSGWLAENTKLNQFTLSDEICLSMTAEGVPGGITERSVLLSWPFEEVIASWISCCPQSGASQEPSSSDSPLMKFEYSEYLQNLMSHYGGVVFNFQFRTSELVVMIVATVKPSVSLTA